MRMFREAGTRRVLWNPSAETDESGVVNLQSITALPYYSLHSLEELRWEDSQIDQGLLPAPPVAAPAPAQAAAAVALPPTTRPQEASGRRTAGTGFVRHRHTQDREDGTWLSSASAMPEHRGKSHEELRWEDTQIAAGVIAAPPSEPDPAPAPASGIFGRFGLFGTDPGEPEVINAVSALPEFGGKSLEEIRWEDVLIAAGRLPPRPVVSRPSPQIPVPSGPPWVRSIFAAATTSGPFWGGPVAPVAPAPVSAPVATPPVVPGQGRRRRSRGSAARASPAGQDQFAAALQPAAVPPLPPSFSFSPPAQRRRDSASNAWNWLYAAPVPVAPSSPRQAQSAAPSPHVPAPPPSSISAPPKEVERLLCKVCMEKEVDVLLLPCSHLCVCQACSDALDTCPICRSDIADAFPVFQS